MSWLLYLKSKKLPTNHVSYINIIQFIGKKFLEYNGSRNCDIHSFGFSKFFFYIFFTKFYKSLPNIINLKPFNGSFTFSNKFHDLCLLEYINI